MSLAFKFHSSSGEYSTSVLPDEENPIEMFGKQLQPVRGDDIFEKMFSSSLHALQVSLIFLSGFKVGCPIAVFSYMLDMVLIFLKSYHKHIPF